MRKRNSPKRASTRVSPGVWAAIPLDADTGDPWQLHVRVVDQDGRAVIAEVHLTPGPDSYGAEDWVEDPDEAGDWIEYTDHKGAVAFFGQTDRYRVPLGGITAGVLRGLGLSHILARISRGLEILDQASDGQIFDEQLLGTHGLTGTSLRRPGSPSHRKRRTDEDLVRVAATYIDVIRSGSHNPRKDTAKALGPGWTTSRVRDYLHSARSRGFLTNAPAGLAGGYLTDKGLEKLDLATLDNQRTSRR